MSAQQSTVVYRVVSQRAAWRQAGEEVVVLDTTESVYFGLDPAGALLWRRLVDGATTDELIETLVGTAEVDRYRAAGDVARFLAELDGYGLVERA